MTTQVLACTAQPPWMVQVVHMSKQHAVAIYSYMYMYSSTQSAAYLKTHVVDDFFRGTSHCVESCNEVLHTKMHGQLPGREERKEVGESFWREAERKEERGRRDIG